MGLREIAASPKLGEILLKHTSLTQQQLDEALTIQSQEGGLLGEILVRKNMILPHEMMRALCMQIGLPFIEDLKPNEIDPKLLGDIPINYAKTKEVIPVAKEKNANGRKSWSPPSPIHSMKSSRTTFRPLPAFRSRSSSAPACAFKTRSTASTSAIPRTSSKRSKANSKRHLRPRRPDRYSRGHRRRCAGHQIRQLTHLPRR